MKMLNKIILIAVALMLSACGSSPYKYYVEPTPIVKGNTRYHVGEVKVKLNLGHGAPEEGTSFVSEEELNLQFIEAINKHLAENNLIANSDSKDSFKLNIDIDYTRTFNYGGRSLNKPQVSHMVQIVGEQGQLASFSQSKYTTNYGGFKDAAVNLEITAGNWDAEDEPKDIDLVSAIIVEDLAGLGE
ncbi:hypothetical protein OAG1_23230 [Agarivorans sp. OAG1]|nr:hypothetical protein OAG1_23230 [Agarivorans sp. OAG1]